MSGVTKVQTIRAKRENEDQNSRQKQLQFEAAQTHLENIKFEVERKIFLKSEKYVKYL
jgi:hypothetical protein